MHNGHHGETLLIVADESQALEDDQLVALQGCVVADNNWLLLSWNSLNTGGPFHCACRSNDPSWQRTKVTAPEVVEDPEAEHIRGLVTKKGVDNIRQTWGQDSAHFHSRCMAEWPAQAADAMFPEVAIQAAFARWHNTAFQVEQRHDGLTLGVDVGASEDGDPSAMAVAYGGWVKELVVWYERDTMLTVARVIAEFRRLHVARVRGTAFQEREAAILQSTIGSMFKEASGALGDPCDYSGFECEIYVDEIGVGRGVSDRLREVEYPVTPFNASRRPTSEHNQTQYANLRAEAAARFRTRLIQGEIGLPYSPELEQELRTCRGFLNPSGKLQIISKDTWKQVIHRSPDRLDAVIMATAGRGFISFGGASDLTGPIPF
jgi:phage terminase large subunit